MPTPITVPRGELAGLLSAGCPTSRITDLVLEWDVRRRLVLVLLEQRQQDRLTAQGFAPMRRLLLIRPSGTGKTMTASALARELRLPLFVIRLDNIITKFMAARASWAAAAISEMAGIAGAASDSEESVLYREAGKVVTLGARRRATR